jgi:hypothetical protein
MTTPTRNTLPPELQIIIDKIRCLRDYTDRTGFRTTRSERDLLAQLAADDLAVVLLALQNGIDNDSSH